MKTKLKQKIRDELKPIKVEYAIKKIKALGFKIPFITNSLIRFKYNGENILFYPYSGWHIGKSIKEGKGLNKLLNQIK